MFILSMVQNVLEEDCPNVYSSYEISATEVGSEKFSCSSQVLFAY